MRVGDEIPMNGLCPLLQAFDMTESVLFYTRRLGFTVAQHSPALGEGEGRYHWAWLRRDGAELMLNSAYEFDEERPAERPAAVRSAHGDVTLYIGCPDVDGACATLRAGGLDVPDPVTTGYGMRQLYFSDPDGYGVCLQWPAPASSA